MISILEYFIVFAAKPSGFLVSAFFLIFCEYKLAKSIIKDAEMVQVNNFLNSIKTYTLESKPFIFARNKISDVIHMRRHLVIRDVSSGDVMDASSIEIDNWFHQAGAHLSIYNNRI